MAAQLERRAGNQHAAEGGAGQEAEQGEQQVAGLGQRQVRQRQAQQRGGAGQVRHRLVAETQQSHGVDAAGEKGQQKSADLHPAGQAGEQWLVLVVGNKPPW